MSLCFRHSDIEAELKQFQTFEPDTLIPGIERKMCEETTRIVHQTWFKVAITFQLMFSVTGAALVSETSGKVFSV